MVRLAGFKLKKTARPQSYSVISPGLEDVSSWVMCAHILYLAAAAKQRSELI